MTDGAGTQITLCRQCKTEIPVGAKICSTCNSYQDWRSFIPFSNTALALITALISVAGISGPLLYKAVHTPRSEASITMPSVDGTTLRVVVINRGDAPASLGRVWVDSEYLAGATKVRLRNDSDAIIQPGSKLLTFDIIPLLDEDDSYSSSVEMMSLVLQKKSAPRTEIRFQLLQSDGRFVIQTTSLDAEQLFQLLRANSDRCSSIKTPDFENGCIGRGTPNEARLPAS
ncbi:hypothetical protein [Paraburkholderia aspalathi]|uniref:Uncharacterized protein n=1 Tax=Paraburkholderia aspalathi TaxID=1324617 RepID=A0A1I7AA63_9BURK|nr:hypothetical protein [Paraburkholderia aspalathi]SFT71855.1 hypothetical protein SAMN05192563_1003214 [Paraburkholderia aspalathi]